jgi:hypothetical protein
MKSIQVNLRMPLELHAEAKKRGIGVATEILRLTSIEPGWWPVVAGLGTSDRIKSNGPVTFDPVACSITMTNLHTRDD